MSDLIGRLLGSAPPEALQNLASKPTPYEEALARAGHLNTLPGTLRHGDCAACLNRGYVWRSRQDGSFWAARCECMRARRSLKRMQSSGLIGLLETCTFDRYIPREPWQERAKARALAFVDSGAGSWFCALGSVGAGKTHLCTAICGAELGRGRDVHYMLWLRDAPRLKGVAECQSERTAALERLATAQVLYIDDFFKCEGSGARQFRASPSAADIKLAHEILNSRYIANRTTLISSEWSINELLDFDEAIGSRIYERAKGFTLNFTGDKNQRLKP